jgi:hypothetical protein
MASMIFSSILWSSLRCRPVDHLGGVWTVGKQYCVWEMIEDGLLNPRLDIRNEIETGYEIRMSS